MVETRSPLLGRVLPTQPVPEVALWVFWAGPRNGLKARCVRMLRVLACFYSSTLETSVPKTRGEISMAQTQNWTDSMKSYFVTLSLISPQEAS